MNGVRSPRGFWGWATFGLCGSLLMALAGPRAVADASSPWWYRPSIPGGHDVATVLVFVGMALLCAAWLALGRFEYGDSKRDLLIVAVAWLVPLALGPVLFSRDVYSYLAQGTILHLGANPYHTPPQALAGLGRQHVLGAVSPFWRHTTAPYGPLFLGLVSVIVSVTGSHLVAGVLAIRGLELLGVVATAVSVPRIARSLGASVGRGLWLAVLSPLLALELIAPGHNDVLMIGLLTAGVAAALRGQPMWGIALCALAATIKVPALAGSLFIAVAWARAERSSRDQAIFALQAALTVAVRACRRQRDHRPWLQLADQLAVLDARQGPSRDHAGDAAGWTVADLLRGAGVAIGHRTVASLLGDLTLLVTLVVGVSLLYRVRVAKLALYLGALLSLSAIARSGGVAVVLDLGARAARRLPGDPALPGAGGRHRDRRVHDQAQRHPRVAGPVLAARPCRLPGARAAGAVRVADVPARTLRRTGHGPLLSELDSSVARKRRRASILARPEPDHARQSVRPMRTPGAFVIVAPVAAQLRSCR